MSNRLPAFGRRTVTISLLALALQPLAALAQDHSAAMDGKAGHTTEAKEIGQQVRKALEAGAKPIVVINKIAASTSAPRPRRWPKTSSRFRK